MDANRRCGRPSTVMSRCMRSSPNRMPNSSSESRYSSACAKFIKGSDPFAVLSRFELRQRVAVLRELPALLVHDGGRSLRDELLVGQLLLGPLDLGGEVGALLLDPRLRLARVEGVRGEHLDRAA